MLRIRLSLSSPTLNQQMWIRIRLKRSYPLELLDPDPTLQNNRDHYQVYLYAVMSTSKSCGSGFNHREQSGSDPPEQADPIPGLNGNDEALCMYSYKSRSKVSQFLTRSLSALYPLQKNPFPLVHSRTQFCLPVPYLYPGCTHDMYLDHRQTKPKFDCLKKPDPNPN